MVLRRQIPRLFSWIFLALTLLGVILRTVCMLFLFDADVGYFQRGFLPTFSNVLYFVVVTAAIACTALTPRDTLPTDLHTQGRLYPALLMGLALGGFTVAVLLVPTLLTGISGKMTLAANLLGLPAAFYFFCSARKDGRYPDWLSLLGFLPVIWCLTAVADTYFDVYVTMNSPVKVAVQMGLLGFMLIMLAELRFRVGKALPRYSLAFLAVGSYACLVGSIPQLCAFAKFCFSHGNALRPSVGARYALYAAVLLMAGIYGLYLFLRYAASPIAEPSSEGNVEDVEADFTNISESDNTQTQ